MPRCWQVETEVDVMLAEEPLDYLTPDVVVFDKAIPLTTRLNPGQAVELVVGVLSKGSSRDDRGIHAFELDAGRYVQVGEHVGPVRVARPFPVELVLEWLAE